MIFSSFSMFLCYITEKKSLLALLLISLLLSGRSSATDEVSASRVEIPALVQEKEGEKGFLILQDQSKIATSLVTVGDYLPFLKYYGASDQGHRWLYHEETMKGCILCEQTQQGWDYRLADPSVEKATMIGLSREDVFLFLDWANDALWQVDNNTFFYDLPTCQELCTLIHNNREIFSTELSEWTSDLVQPSTSTQDASSRGVIFSTTPDSTGKALVASPEIYPAHRSSPQVGFRIVQRLYETTTRTDPSLEKAVGTAENEKFSSNITSASKAKKTSSLQHATTSTTSTDSTKEPSSFPTFSDISSFFSSSHLAGMINGALGVPLVTEGEMAAISQVAEIGGEIAAGAVLTTAAFAIPGVEPFVLATQARMVGEIVEGMRAVAALGDIGATVGTSAASVSVTSEVTTVAADVAAHTTTVTRGAHTLEEAATESRVAAAESRAATTEKEVANEAGVLKNREPGSPSSSNSLKTSSVENSVANLEKDPATPSTSSHASGDSPHSTNLDHTSSPATSTEKVASVTSVKLEEELSYEEWEKQLNKQLFEEEQRLRRAGRRMVTDDETLAEEQPHMYVTREEALAERELYAATRKNRPELTDRLNLSSADQPTAEELGDIYNPHSKIYPSISSNHRPNATPAPKSNWSWPFSLWGKS